MSGPDSQPAEETVSLAQLAKGERGVVASLSTLDAAAVGDAEGSTVARRLLELGFVQGESVQVVATAWPGHDPMAVRVGAGVFALRRREARAVRVHRSPP